MSTDGSESNEHSYEGRSESENPRQLVPRDPGLVPNGPLYKRIDRYYDTDYAEWRVVATPTETVVRRDEYSDFAFLVRRNLDQEKQYQDTILIIKSPDLGAIINDVVHNVEGLSVIGNSSEISPHILYHFLDELRNFEITPLIFLANPEEAKAHLAALISFLQSEYEFEVTFADQLLSFDPPHITFSLLWLIFRPNTLVFTETGEEGLSGRLLSLQLPLELSNGFRLNCKSINFDGKNVGYEKEKFTIDEFTGSTPITTLPFYPFRFHTQHAWLQRRFADRGRKFNTLCRLGKLYVFYKGIAEAIGESFGEQYHTGIKFDLRNRVMIDPATFWNLESPGNKPSIKKFEHNYNRDLDDAELQLCNTWLPGFIMEHKKWGFIPINQVTDIQWAGDMLDHVVLEETTKELIRGFVKAHGSDSSSGRSEDVVPGKGAGLVMLFTGPPGVGKTVTAEAVAEISKRPLYSISSSELGSMPSELDRNLTKILRQGTLWNAVLLLDEADVFLEQRTSFDVKRNSLVSIFLRQLEYYKGIIVLTSNRVETFDKALESRVHFNLRFKELDTGSRKRLWSYFITEHNHLFADPHLTDLSQLKFNGRMIQHAVALGRSLSKARGEVFSYDHVQRVLDFIDPARRIQIFSNDKGRLPDASPADPSMSITQTPRSDSVMSPDDHRGSKRPRFG
ncbi:P-loop containing nucleoside triphosphate hydrolase protein [Morchella snyderi]|nr:P-loop containing nucleoside triphosphate hydrolase protein [Morchella snyderi]